MFNVLIGITWQVSLVILPHGLVLKEYPSLILRLYQRSSHIHHFKVYVVE